MLDTQLLPQDVMNHEDLKRIIDDCVATLEGKPSPSPEMINQILVQLELAVQKYTNTGKAKYFRLFKSSKSIKVKKSTLFALVGDTIKDIKPVIKLIHRCYKLFTHDTATTQFEGVLKPLIDLNNDILNEVIRINTYGNDIKDILRFQLGVLHCQIANFYLLVHNNAKMIFHLQKKFDLADVILTEQYKESLFIITDVFIIAKAYLNLNDLASAANVLRLEREWCLSEASEMYYRYCIDLAAKFATQQEYSQAIAWNNEALNICESMALNLRIGDLISKHIDQMTQYLETISRTSSIMLEPPEHMNKRMMMAADHKVSIEVGIPEWSPETIARLKQLAGKFAFDFAPEKLIVHKLSSVSVKDLTKIIAAMNKLEKEHQTRLNRQLKNPIEDLQSRLETLAIAELSLVCSSSYTTSIPSCSTDTVAPSSAKKASIKPKTRGKPHKRRQTPTKASVPAIQALTCDAEKYGFSRALFGMHSFQECRMRGDSQRVFYVVKGKIEASNRRCDNHYLFDSLIAEPKIVPPCGEEDFKWMKVGERQVLVGKVLSTKKRLFPLLAQRNEQGAIAFLYGSIVNTKNGIAADEIKHYSPSAGPKLRK